MSRRKSLGLAGDEFNAEYCVKKRPPLRAAKIFPNEKVIGFTILGAVVLISAFLLPSKLNQARREACYRTVVASFQRDLHIGADRAEVQQYLHSRKLDYHVVKYGGNDADTYEIKIGEEPSNSLVCEDWEGVETSDSAQDPWPDHSE